MPIAVSKICRAPGCGRIAASNGYCIAHQGYARQQRRESPRQAAVDDFRSSAAWKRFRSWFVAQHPLCCDPFGAHKDEAEPTQQVHHVIGLSENIDLGLAEDNARPLCTRCHARIEALVRAGQATKRLFPKTQDSSALM
jgi:5-methylcytosine-specific restriction protein A